MTLDTELLFRVADACDVDAPSVADDRAFYEAVTPPVVLALLRQAKDDAAEIKAMRESLIHVCGLLDEYHDNSRQIWAVRQAANHKAKRFSHEWVQEKYNGSDQWQSVDSLRQQVRELTGQRNGHRAALNRIADQLCVVHEDDKIERAVSCLRSDLSAALVSVDAMAKRLEQLQPIVSVLGDWDWAAIGADVDEVGTAHLIDDRALMSVVKALAHTAREQAKEGKDNG